MANSENFKMQNFADHLDKTIFVLDHIRHETLSVFSMDFDCGRRIVER